MIEAKGLSVGYGRNVVVGDIEASLLPASLTVLIGSNGSGKSTLLRTLSASQPPLSGEVLLDGLSVRRIKSSELARRLAVVLTDRSGGDGLRLEELVAIGRTPYTNLFGRLSEEDKAVVEKSIEAVGLSHKMGRQLQELSDGERQKAMIARALAQDTPTIILDEPTSFLDVSSRFDIMRMLAGLAADTGKSILLSTHDTAAALPMASQVWAIAGGKLSAGTAGELAANGVLDTVFPGMRFDASACDFRII